MKKLSSVLAIAVALAFAVNLHANEFSEHFIAARAGVVNTQTDLYIDLKNLHLDRIRKAKAVLIDATWIEAAQQAAHCARSHGVPVMVNLHNPAWIFCPWQTMPSFPNIRPKFWRPRETMRVRCTI